MIRVAYLYIWLSLALERGVVKKNYPLSRWASAWLEIMRRMLLVPKNLLRRREAGTANLWRDAAATAISISLIHPDKVAAGRERTLAPGKTAQGTQKKSPLSAMFLELKNCSQI